MRPLVSLRKKHNKTEQYMSQIYSALEVLRLVNNVLEEFF